MQSDILEKIFIQLADGNGRNISPYVKVDKIDLPETTAAQHMAWVDALADYNPLPDVGDILICAEKPPASLQNLLTSWAVKEGLEPDDSIHGPRLMACDGATFHVDLEFKEYENCAFSILWLEEESQWDLLFPQLGIRVPLEKGTHVLFDSGAIHGVVARGTNVFEREYFENGLGFQMFFSDEHPYTSEALRRKMGVELRPVGQWEDRRSTHETRYRHRICQQTGALSLSP